MNKIIQVESRSFTTRFSGRSNKLYNEILVKTDTKDMKAVALWDTGATRTCVSDKVASALNLIPIGQSKIQTAGGESIVNAYCISLVLPNNVTIKDVDYVINENTLEDVNYPMLCDIMRRIPMKDVEPLNIKNVYDLSKLFSIASLAVPGYHEESKNKNCFIVSDDNNIDFVIHLLNKNVSCCDVLHSIPLFVQELDVSISQKQMRKIHPSFSNRR